jgi:hypothetical protein
MLGQSRGWSGEKVWLPDALEVAMQRRNRFVLFAAQRRAYISCEWHTIWFASFKNESKDCESFADLGEMGLEEWACTSIEETLGVRSVIVRRSESSLGVRDVLLDYAASCASVLQLDTFGICSCC